MLGSTIPSSDVKFEIENVNFTDNLSVEDLMAQPEIHTLLQSRSWVSNIVSVGCTLQLDTCMNKLAFAFRRVVDAYGNSTQDSYFETGSSETLLRRNPNTKDHSDVLKIFKVEAMQLIHEEVKSLFGANMVRCDPMAITAIAPFIYRNLRTKSLPIVANLLTPFPDCLFSEFVQTYQIQINKFEIEDHVSGMMIRLNELKQDAATLKEQAKSNFEFKSVDMSRISDYGTDKLIGTSAKGLNPAVCQLVLKGSLTKHTETGLTESKWQSKQTLKSIVESSGIKKSQMLTSTIATSESNLGVSKSVAPGQDQPTSVSAKVYESTMMQTAEPAIGQIEDRSSVKYVMLLTEFFLEPPELSHPQTRSFCGLKGIRNLLIPFSNTLDFKIAKLVCLSKIPSGAHNRNGFVARNTNINLVEQLVKRKSSDSDDDDDSDEMNVNPKEQKGAMSSYYKQPETKLDYLIEHYLNVQITQEPVSGTPVGVFTAKSIFCMVLPEVADQQFFLEFTERVKRENMESLPSANIEAGFYDFEFPSNPFLIQINSGHYMNAYSFDLSPHEDSVQMIEGTLYLTNVIIRMKEVAPALENISVISDQGLADLGLEELRLHSSYLDFFDVEASTGEDSPPAELLSITDEQSTFCRYLVYLDHYIEWPNNKSLYLTLSEQHAHQVQLGPCKCLNSKPGKDDTSVCNNLNVPPKNRQCLANTDPSDQTVHRLVTLSKTKLYLMLWDFKEHPFKWAFPKINLLSPSSSQQSRASVVFEPFRFGFTEVASLSGVKCLRKYSSPNSTIIDSQLFVAQEVSISGTLPSLEKGVDFIFPSDDLISFDFPGNEEEVKLFLESPRVWSDEQASNYLERKKSNDKIQDFVSLKTSLFDDLSQHLRLSFAKRKTVLSNFKVRLIQGTDFIGRPDNFPAEIIRRLEELLSPNTGVKEFQFGTEYTRVGAGATSKTSKQPTNTRKAAKEFDQNSMIPMIQMFQNKRQDSYFELSTDRFEREELKYFGNVKNRHSIWEPSNDMSPIKLFLKHGESSPIEPFLLADHLFARFTKSTPKATTTHGATESDNAPPSLDSVIPTVYIDCILRGSDVSFVSAVIPDLTQFIKVVLEPADASDFNLCLISVLIRLFGRPFSTSNTQYFATLSMDPFIISAGMASKASLTINVPAVDASPKISLKESMFDIYKQFLCQLVSKHNSHLHIETKFKDYPMLLKTFQNIKHGINIVTNELNKDTAGGVFGKIKGMFKGS